VITICDTGPLVAYLNRNDPYHSWAVALMKQARSPMLTTEPVLSEAAYFLRADHVDVDPLFQLLELGAVDVDPLFQLLELGAVRLDLQVAEHWPRLRTLMTPMNTWIWPTRRLSF
jgi:predicted nucleic acid-binding protein